MSKSVNKVLLLGNVGKDPEVKYLTSGTAVASFSLACNYRVKKNDEWVDQTEWVNVKAFAKTAEIVEKYVTKGKQLYIEGRLQTSSWENNETGKKVYRTEVVVNELVLLGGKDGNKDEFDQRRHGTDETGSQVRPTEFEEEDIPF